MQDHRSLIAWQRAREVVLDICHRRDSLWRRETSAMVEQLQRSALSAQLNLAEGYAWRPGLRWQNHLAIAYGSAVETTDLLDLLLDLSDPGDRLLELRAKSIEVQAMALALLRKARSNSEQVRSKKVGRTAGT
jgi:four helix bundle protein